MNTITIGDIEVVRIEETHGPFGLTAEQFIPDVPDDAWQRHEPMLVPDHVNPDDRLALVAMQTWLLRSGERTILIDTGVGNGKSRPLVPVWDQCANDTYLTNLARAGVSPADVDLVVNTHLHVDHVGWNTRFDGEWLPTFPNATYLMPKIDFEYWNPATNPNIAGGVNEHVYEDSVAPVHAAGQVRLWEDEYAIDANLRLEAAPGHTPGSSVVKLTTGDERALFAGDLLHSPVQIPEPEHNSCFCEDPVTARAVRRKLLGWAVENNALVLPAHFSGHGAFRTGYDGAGFAVSTWAPFDTL